MRGKTEKEMLIEISRGHLAKTSGERGQGLRSDFGHTGSQFYFTAIINLKTPLKCFLGLFLEQKGQSHKT